MRWWQLAGASLLVVCSGYYHHEADSPGVGAFPGRRLASEYEPRRLQVAPLYGSINDFAYYFIDVLIGTPPRRQSVILDSGSSLLGFSCVGCGRNCGHHLDEPFDVSQSRTADRYSCYDRRCVNKGVCRSAANDTCLYSQVYSEGSSIEGFFFSDKIAIGDQIDHNAFVTYDYIGCHTRETVLFTTQQASGILGVSFPKGGRQPTVMDVLMNSRQVNSKVFSLCVAEDGGLLSVGGYNSSYHKPSTSLSITQQGFLDPIKRANMRGSGLTRGWNLRSFIKDTISGAARTPESAAVSHEEAAHVQDPASTPNTDIVWAKINSDSTYSVDLARIIMPNHPRQVTDSMDGGFGDVLVDSGTTYSYFPNDIYHAIARELIEICHGLNAETHPSKQAGQCIRGKSDLVCFHFKDDRAPVETYLSRIPSFHVQFGNGGIIEWAAESWLFRKSDRVWCSAIENNRRKQTILGMSFMKKKEVIFDRDNSYIGFVSAECPPHYAYMRPDPPSRDFDSMGGRMENMFAGRVDQVNAAPGGGETQSMNELSPSLVNDTGLWSWTGAKSLPYMNAGQQYQGGGVGDGDTNRLSWIIGGGVGASVVGALVALVAKSTSRTAYDPVVGQRWEEGVMSSGSPHLEVPEGTQVLPHAPGAPAGTYPNFDDLEHASDLLR